MAKTATKLRAPVRKAGTKALQAVGRRVLESGASLARGAADRATDAGKTALEKGLARRLPIQVSIDVAVPLAVAWDEWMSLETLTEGVHRIEEIERNGRRMVGKTAGPRPSDWEAEIVDEREHESFAWRSLEGTDCAGLVTFHQLSDRLTRIELDLDVLPTGPAEMLALSLQLARRRAEAELRRFKARVEFINPDVYEPQNGKGPKTQDND